MPKSSFILHVRIDPEVHEALQEVAKKRKTTVSDLSRRGIFYILQTAMALKQIPFNSDLLDKSF